MTKKLLAAAAFLALAAAACQLASSIGLQVTNHPQPEFPPPNLAPFEAAGCTFDEYGNAECPPDSPIAALGCDQLRRPDDLLGGLVPRYPLAVCLYYPTRHISASEGDPFATPKVYNEGCMMPAFVRYVVARDGDFEMLSTPEGLQAAFAPIDSPGEALSYSLAATGLSAYFGLKREMGYRYFIDGLEDTNVRQTGDNFQINLYHYQVCGCGPHTYSIITVRVDPDGNLQTTEGQPAFENPAEDGLCVD